MDVPHHAARGGSIAMQGERTRVSMLFTVTPTLTERLPEAEAKPDLGTYLFKIPKRGKEDSRLFVTYERGGLKSRFEPKECYLQTFALMKVAPDRFTVGLFMSAQVYADGEIYEVLRPDFMIMFTVKDGQATVESRGVSDELYVTGRRTKSARRSD